MSESTICIPGSPLYDSMQTGSYPAIATTTTEPADGNGVRNVINAGSGSQSFNNIILFPFGVGSSGQTFDMLVVGWKPTPKGLWLPFPLAEYNCTLGTVVGQSGDYEVTDSENFVSIISLAEGNENISNELFSTVTGRVGHTMVDLKGSHKFQVFFNLGTATSANTLVNYL